MSFLAPLFLIGAAAIALPFVFHLIRRSSKEHITFSSLMFLRPAPPRVTKRSRLEHLFLLLLRCLAVCLLALAFARPFLQQPMEAAQPTETSRKVIVLVDTSASMKREGLWQAAAAKAADVLGQASPADQVAVFTFDTQARSFVSFAQWAAMEAGDRAAVISARLAALTPGWRSTHLGNALTTAAEAFSEVDKQGMASGRRRVVLITDLQEGSRLDGLQGYEWPRDTEVVIETIAPKRPTNAGLQWIVETGDSAQSETNITARIRVSNSSTARREQFQLRWDGVPGATLDVYVPPGQNRIVPAPILPTNATAERLVLTGDDDEFDNTIHVIQPKAEQIRVLYLGDDTASNSAQPLYFLKRAFQQTRREMIEVKPYQTSAPIPQPELAEARLLIATGKLPESQIVTARTFMAGGGTVFMVMTNAASAADVGRLAGVDGLTAQDIISTNYAMLETVDFQHPLFAPFSDPRYNDFTKIHFWKYRKLDAAKIPDSRALAKFDSGDAALLEIPRDKGRLLVLTSGWQPADSQLALSSKFVPLLYAILDLSGGIKARLTQAHIGGEVNLADVLPPGGAQSVSVQKPDGAQVQVAAGEPGFSQTDLPGIYTVASQPSPTRFAVNLDGSESRTGPMAVDELERLGVPLKPREVNVAMQVEQKRRLHDAELEGRQKLWRWLTFAALVVLLCETWVAGWLTRRAAFQTGVNA